MQSYDVTEVLTGLRSAGCIERHIRSFARHLIGCGYTLLSSREYVRAAAHLGRWMDIRGIPPEKLSDDVLSKFARHQCRCPGACLHGRSPSPKYVARARRFVEHLRRQDVVPAVAETPACKVAAPLCGFREWMVSHRGLTVCTINRYEHLVRRMLPALGEDPALYDASLIRRVFLAATQGFSQGYAKCFVSALRAFLRFLTVEGRCRAHLDRAVPTIPEWRLSALPRYIGSSDVERVIASCDLSKPCGVRDRAVLLLLARLGLRAGDIVAMDLDDLDWGAGTVRVRAKHRKEVRLPLPQDVGESILDYLTRARPPTDITRVFLCTNAPIRPFQTTTNVSDIVRLALGRAGISNPPSKGAHLLRHSAATGMLRAGASLDAIATVLRHQSTDTTAHYAKVDVELLRSVAQPWPEVPQC